MLSTETFFVENIKCDGCVKTITEDLVTGVAMDRDIMKNKLALPGYPEKASNVFLKKAKSLLHCVMNK